MLSSHRRMIASLAYLLSVCVAIPGCYSYRDATKEELAVLRSEPGQDIEVTLTDGSSFGVEAYHYVWVDTPDTFLFGKGEAVDTATGEAREFRGRIDPHGPASTGATVSSGWGMRDTVTNYEFPVSGGSVVRLSARDLVSVRGDREPSFWYNGSDDDVSHSVLQAEVGKVGVKQLSTVKTVLAVVAVGLTVVMGIALSGMTGDWGDFTIDIPSH